MGIPGMPGDRGPPGLTGPAGERGPEGPQVSFPYHFSFHTYLNRIVPTYLKLVRISWVQKFRNITDSRLYQFSFYLPQGQIGPEGRPGPPGPPGSVANLTSLVSEPGPAGPRGAQGLVRDLTLLLEKIVLVA